MLWDVGDRYDMDAEPTAKSMDRGVARWSWGRQAGSKDLVARRRYLAIGEMMVDGLGSIYREFELVVVCEGDSEGGRIDRFRPGVWTGGVSDRSHSLCDLLEMARMMVCEEQAGEL